MKKLNKNTSGLTRWELENPSLLIFANRYLLSEKIKNKTELYQRIREIESKNYKNDQSSIHTICTIFWRFE